VTTESELRKAYGYAKADGVMLEELTPGELMKAYVETMRRYEMRLEQERREAMALTPPVSSVGQA